ncbi:MAG: hypothetical protein ABW110_19200 [Steroidobacteraceae bacterium]
MRRFIQFSAITATLLTLVSCTSCVPTPPDLRDSDAGNYSFVRQAVPKITGRKARGYAEVKALADMIAASDRPTVVKAMFRETNTQHEYVDHWSENTVDFLRAHRESGKQITGSGNCLANPLRASDYALQLAEFLRDHGPASPAPGPAFNLSDVLRSSLVLDDLSPTYRAYLFAMVNRPITGAEVTEQNQRDDLGVSLSRIYTHRQLGCLGCHNTINSTTGPLTQWNRHFPIRGRFSHALFGQSTGRPADEVNALLRTDLPGGIQPWGLDGSCGSFVAAASVPDDTLTSPGGSPINAFFITSRGRRGSVWQLESALDTGVKNIAARGLERGNLAGSSAGQCSYCTTSTTCPSGSGTAVPPLSGTQVAQENAARTVLMNNGCFGCHSGGSGSFFMNSMTFPAQTKGKAASRSTKLLVWPGDATRSYLFDKISSTTDPLADGTGRMPLGGGMMSAADINIVRDWINGMAPAAACNVCPSSGCESDFVDGNDAFAFLTASRVVENTWSELFGAPLTIANNFPRNQAQRDILWNLTELHFVRAHWSMEGLVSRMLTSEFFNRQSPSQTTGPSAYELPNYLDPWTAADPRVPPVALPGSPPGSGTVPTPDPAYDANDEANRPHQYNAMSDGVHRYTPRSLLYSVHKALGWRAPPREASLSTYPSDTLRKSIGQFYRDAEPGFREIGFQGLLNWEGSHGTCAKPANHTGDDWIDKLVLAIAAFNATHASAPVKVRDLVIAMKDRIIADPSLMTSTPTDAPSSETVALQALFDTPLTSTVDVSTAAATTALTTKLRNYCGVLLETPQFMLAGVAPTQLGEKPRLLVCLPGEPCGYREICNSYGSAFHSIGKQLTCSDNSVSITDVTIAPGFDRFCRKGQCAVIPLDLDRHRVDLCLSNPKACLPQPPPCDPRCQRIDCCGGPLPPLDGNEMFLIWADGGKVKSTSGVRVLRATGERFETLGKSEVLHTGDVLVLDPKSRLDVATQEGGFRTPDGGLAGRDDKRRFWIVQVTGPQALDPKLRETEVKAVDMKQALDMVNNAYWLQSGEAGSPTIPNQAKAPSDIPGRARNPPRTPATLDFDLQKKYRPIQEQPRNEKG